ncbi:nucleobase-ascorbate transporter 12-like [Glycine soja]|uniref:nucleobase-ascorbate transporter 12-like n=1 Tax=Glycine soja TaxID=3848 RepID=UPI00103D1BAD|nr:nucleobase-ascorbate transporter 12-like [Glycine soja]
MSFLGETSSQTIANSILAFIFLNGSITHNQTGVYFQSPTPTPMRVPNDCSFDTLKRRMHNTLQLTNDQLMDEIYYRQPFIDAELLCTIIRTPDAILNLLQSTITPTHDAVMYYNGKWNIPRQVKILVVIVFSLYLRKISVLGHRLFLIYAVPLGLAITWAFAFLLTEAGVYNYKGCDVNIPASNMVSEHCRKHFSRMRHCRVSSTWFRFPYPLQWGTPVFHWKMAIVMCVVSLISSVDSVGSYHASSLLVASRPPTPGVLSRGIGLEGLSSVLAGLWGTGTGSTTLTENVHTIAVTKMGSRKAVQLGACFLIVLSLVGLQCFYWKTLHLVSVYLMAPKGFGFLI